MIFIQAVSRRLGIRAKPQNQCIFLCVVYCIVVLDDYFAIRKKVEGNFPLVYMTKSKITISWENLHVITLQFGN